MGPGLNCHHSEPPQVYTYIYIHISIYKAGPAGYSLHGACHAMACPLALSPTIALATEAELPIHCWAANLERWVATMQLATSANLARANMLCKP